MNNKNVFINCPFDNDYFPLLKSLLFTIIYLDFNPLISETKNSGESRLEKIIEMMTNSLYSIHDISRIEVKKGAYPRFNMPFECGIDFGIKKSNISFSNKQILILEKEQYRYKQYISDISGNDIEAHNNSSQEIMSKVRNWFRKKDKNVVQHINIWVAYSDFISNYDDLLNEWKLDPDDINAIPFTETIDMMKEWIKDFKKDFRH